MHCRVSYRRRGSHHGKENGRDQQIQRFPTNARHARQLSRAIFAANTTAVAIFCSVLPPQRRQYLIRMRWDVDEMVTRNEVCHIVNANRARGSRAHLVLANENHHILYGVIPRHLNPRFIFHLKGREPRRDRGKILLIASPLQRARKGERRPIAEEFLYARGWRRPESPQRLFDYAARHTGIPPPGPGNCFA